MKKNYFMLAAATMMLAACAETDLVNEVNSEKAPQAIGFDAFANKATRAEIEDDTELQTTGFSVWGYKAPTANPVVWTSQYTVFDNMSVTYNNTTATWNPSTTKYWDRTSTYKFYAAAPVQPSGVTYGINPATGMISITGAASAISTASNDFLIDRNGAMNINGDYTGTEHNSVEFDFHHIMSKLSFQLIAGVPEEITITSLTMSGWNNNTGNFVQGLTDEPTSTTDISEWSITAPGSAGVVNLVGGNASDQTIILNSDQTVSPITDEYIMVPQQIDAETLTFTVSFTINGESFVNQVGEVATTQIWGTDTHTTYTITVGPDDINFGVSSVCGFDAGKPDSNLEIE